VKTAGRKPKSPPRAQSAERQPNPAPPRSAPGALDSLRRQIDPIDHQIHHLLAERRDAAQQVARVKHRHDLPLYHPAREENLISARRASAIAAGLDPDFVEDIFRRLVSDSRTKQLDTLSRRSVRPGAKVLLVGGRGSMGTFFARWFAQSDYQVRILDRHDWSRVKTLAGGVDLAVLAVPIEITPAVALRLSPFLDPQCLLCDIASLKLEPVDAMLRGHPGPVLGLHPLFGPNTVTLDKQIVAVSPGRNPAACAWLIDQFVLWGCVPVHTPAGEHDEIMGIVQAVRHFATFAFGCFLHERRVSIARTLELSSPIYRLELGMVGRLFAQNPTLYSQIIFATPQRRALLKGYLDSLRNHIDLIEKGDHRRFQTQFRKVARWFGPFGDQALSESTWLIDQLVHRF
jgi:chorismate mutase/prephenate dehydrogenase